MSKGWIREAIALHTRIFNYPWPPFLTFGFCSVTENRDRDRYLSVLGVISHCVLGPAPWQDKAKGMALSSPAWSWIGFLAGLSYKALKSDFLVFPWSVVNEGPSIYATSIF